MNGARSLPVVMAAIVITTATACTSNNQTTTTDSHTFNLSGDVLRIQAEETSLRLVETSGSKVVVKRRLTGGSEDADTDSSLTMRGNTLTVRAECSGVVKDCDTSSVIQVPRKVRVELEGSGTPVTVDRLSGDLDLKVTNDGSLEVRRPRGRLQLACGGGNIVVTGARSRVVNARTTADGNISLGFAGAPQRVDAESSGSVKVTVPAGPETYRLLSTSTSGNVRSDEDSDRSIKAVARDGAARVQQG